MTQEDVAKMKCPNCGSSLIPKVGNFSVLVLCNNHKQGVKQNLSGNRTCEYSFVIDKSQYLSRLR